MASKPLPRPRFPENKITPRASGTRVDFHLQMTELVIQLAPVANRPPVVEKYLDRPPHRHPAADEQALLEDIMQHAAADRGEQRPRADAGEQKQQTDDEARGRR